MKISEIVHQSWKSDSIPYHCYRRSWIDSWSLLRPGWKRRFWTDADNDALVREHYSHFNDSYPQLIPSIKKADFARLLYMHRFGGIYVDLDFICLKNLRPLLRDYDIVFGRLSPDHPGYQMPNAFLASRPGCSFWLQVADDTVNAPLTEQTQVETHTGPFRLERAHNMYLPANSVVYADKLIYPLDWIDLLRTDKRHTAVELRQKTTQELANAFPDSYCLTFWMHNWSQSF